MPEVHDLGLMIDSHVPLILLQTREEPRALDMLTRLAIKRGMALYGWSCTEGLRRLGLSYDLGEEHPLDDPDALLKHIRTSHAPALYALCDLQPWLEDEPRRIRLIKDIAQNYHRTPNTLLLISHDPQVPGELRHLAARFELRLPNEEQLMTLVREEAARWSEANRNLRVKTDQKTLRQLVANLRGLTFAEARRLARGAIADDGAITGDDIPEVNRAKFELMDMDGVLSFEYDTAQFSDVGGLDNLKRWLEQRRRAFQSPTPGMDPPKGILLLGVQGSGKSLAAKAVAGLWGLPLLRMDFGALYNKFFGETERNLREALRLAELMSPCVLWLDEVEKGLGTGTHDQGVSQRLLGTLLTWMAERKHPVFLVATANDIQRLPPELMRKGRMDEVFFVDLPDARIRETILQIHLRKRQQALADFDVPRLAQLTDGFSGAEIEQAVVAARYSAAAVEAPLSQTLLEEEIARTQPLSVLMGEQVEALRQWALGRTVLA